MQKKNPARTRNCVWASFILLALSLSVCAISDALADERKPLSIWFMPAAGSPDLDDLFRYPKSWSRTRMLVDTFAFSAGQLQSPAPGGLYADLESVDAFRRLKALGLSTAIEAPAIKEWDCSAHQTIAATVGIIKAVYAAKGTVNFIAMDEPLISALGLNKPICHLAIDAAAMELASYATSVLENPIVAASGVVPKFVDVEAYPSLSVDQIEAWLAALSTHGFRPAALHLDVNVNLIDVTNGGHKKLLADLRKLKAYLQLRNIIFGIIIWSGYDPIRSDEEYYDRAMTWVRAIHHAIGRPDRLVFESWVTRCSTTNPCSNPDRGCSKLDPVYCGTISVPLNLPEVGSKIYSHTRLIRDASTLLGK